MVVIVVVIGFCLIRTTDHDHDHDHDQLAEIGTIPLLFSWAWVRQKPMSCCSENSAPCLSVFESLR